MAECCHHHPDSGAASQQGKLCHLRIRSLGKIIPCDCTPHFPCHMQIELIAIETDEIMTVQIPRRGWYALARDIFLMGETPSTPPAQPRYCWNDGMS